MAVESSSQRKWFGVLQPPRLTVTKRIFLALMLSSLPILGMGLMSMREVSHIETSIMDISQNRLPKVSDLAEITIDINASLSTLYGYMLTGDVAFKAERAAIWERLNKTMERYEERAKLSSDAADGEDWTKLRAVLIDYMNGQRVLEGRITEGQMADAVAIIIMRESVVPLAAKAEAFIRGQVGKSDAASAGFYQRQVAALNADAAEAHKLSDDVGNILKYSAVFSLLMVVFVCILIVRGIARPLVSLQSAMSEISSRNYSVPIPSTGRTDEIGAIARTLSVFRDGLLANDRMEVEASQARGLETKRAEIISTAVLSFERTAESFVLAISSAANELEAAARDLSSSAQEATTEAAKVAAASHETSSNVNSLAAAGEELNATAGEIARLLENSAHSTADAVRKMRATDEDVQALANAASKIGDVVNLIGSLAGQTNLLALNATIEAARAGDAGRGFAVVASEVKGLAAQTANASSEIAGIVSEIQRVSGQAIKAITEIDGAIGEIEKSTREIAGTVAQQEKATREIAVNVQQTASGTEDVTRSITQVSSAASNTAAASSQVLGSAADLSRQAEIMRIEVQEFLSTVRAA